MAFMELGPPRLSLHLPGFDEYDTAHMSTIVRPGSRFSIDSDTLPDTRRYGVVVGRANGSRDKDGSGRMRFIAVETIGGIHSRAKKSVDGIRQKPWMGPFARTDPAKGDIKASITWPLPQCPTVKPEDIQTPREAPQRILWPHQIGQYTTSACMPAVGRKAGTVDICSGFHSADRGLPNVHRVDYVPTGRPRLEAHPGPTPPQRGRKEYRLFPRTDAGVGSGSTPGLIPSRPAGLSQSDSHLRSSSQDTIDSDPPVTPTNDVYPPPIPIPHQTRKKPTCGRAFDCVGAPITRIGNALRAKTPPNPFSPPQNAPESRPLTRDPGYFDLPVLRKRAVRPIPMPSHAARANLRERAHPPVLHPAHLGGDRPAPRTGPRPGLSVVTMDWEVEHGDESEHGSSDDEQTAGYGAGSPRSTRAATAAAAPAAVSSASTAAARPSRPHGYRLHTLQTVGLVAEATLAEATLGVEVPSFWSPQEEDRDVGQVWELEGDAPGWRAGRERPSRARRSTGAGSRGLRRPQTQKHAAPAPARVAELTGISAGGYGRTW